MARKRNKMTPNISHLLSACLLICSLRLGSRNNDGGQLEQSNEKMRRVNLLLLAWQLTENLMRFAKIERVVASVE